MKKICVFGASSDAIRDEFKEAAFELGKFLGKSGYGLVFGAGATGLMGKSAQGYRAATDKGELIGVAPRFFDKPGVLFQDCSQMIYTETMRERKEIMEDLADAFVVLPGGIGTFEEFFEVYTLRQLGRHEKPIFVLNEAGYYTPMKDLLLHAMKEGMLGEETIGQVSFIEGVSGLEEAFR